MNICIRIIQNAEKIITFLNVNFVSLDIIKKGSGGTKIVLPAHVSWRNYYIVLSISV
jgi:hypothetical protein